VFESLSIKIKAVQTRVSRGREALPYHLEHRVAVVVECSRDVCTIVSTSASSVTELVFYV
jgi:hypothetical protein|tara:strand:+ start:242 stop:421 length:180 start_codon:yes stop_codon:yes gene_type:complete